MKTLVHLNTKFYLETKVSLRFFHINGKLTAVDEK